MKESKALRKKQLTYTQLVRKILKDRQFARKVHKLVCQARDGDKEAAKKLGRLFTLTDEDLEQCCLPSNVRQILKCGVNVADRPYGTNTTTFLVAFTAVVSQEES
jgi:hypothetical protein